MPSTAAAPPGQYSSNYMMGSAAAGGYPMNPAGMNAQQHQHHLMMHRLQQAQQNQSGIGTPTQQRHFSGHQGTPSSGQHSQFGTPQHPSAGTHPPHQVPTPVPQSANSVTTPQTPTFPLSGQDPTANGSSAPASPGTQDQDKKRLELLLGINTELYYELMFLRRSICEIKDAIKSSTSSEQQEDMKKEEESFTQDQNQYVTVTMTQAQ